jgi:hypothetical protein
VEKDRNPYNGIERAYIVVCDRGLNVFMNPYNGIES